MQQCLRIIVAFFALSGIFGLPCHANAGDNQAIRFYTEQLNPDSILASIEALEAFETRFCLAENRKDIAISLHNRFLSMGINEVFLDSFLMAYPYMGTDYSLWQYNVVARIPGQLTSDSVYILGAHYDAIVPYQNNPWAIAPGANDNASGVAAVLEVARVLAAHNYTPAHTIEFVLFAAEELGLKGSWHHADEAVKRNRRIAAMLNNDMICYATLPANTWTVQIHHYDNARWLADLARTIIDNYTTLQAIETQAFIKYTDSWPFYGSGYHAIFFHQHEETPFYHTVNDRAVNTNKAYATEMTKISMGILVHQNGPGTATGILPGQSPHTAVEEPGVDVYARAGSLHISTLAAAEHAYVQIFDLTGRRLHSEMVPAGVTMAVPYAWPSGIYLVRTALGGRVFTQKMFCY